MREVNVGEISGKISELFISACYDLGDDVLEVFKKARKNEESPIGVAVLDEIIENAKIAKEGVYPLCQDTGLAVTFLDIGQEVCLVGGNLEEAVNEGVKKGYQEGYLRKSVCDCFTRKNTGDNTPAILHIRIVPGDKIHIACAPKGGGSENMSRVTLMAPASGAEGVKNFVIQRVKESGSNPCPPIVVGVGIGGNLEQSAILAKRSLLRPLGKPNPSLELANMEQEILEKVNRLGIGPAGLGGNTTALAVHIEMMPCHLASLPVAVNINCHSHRHKEAVI